MTSRTGLNDRYLLNGLEAQNLNTAGRKVSGEFSLAGRLSLGMAHKFELSEPVAIG